MHVVARITNNTITRMLKLIMSESVSSMGWAYTASIVSAEDVGGLIMQHGLILLTIRYMYIAMVTYSMATYSRPMRERGGGGGVRGRGRGRGRGGGGVGSRGNYRRPLRGGGRGGGGQRNGPPQQEGGRNEEGAPRGGDHNAQPSPKPQRTRQPRREGQGERGSSGRQPQNESTEPPKDA